MQLSTTCAVCGERYGAETWSACALVEVLRFEDLRHVIQSWPWSKDVALVVRRCRCGSTFVRREVWS